MNRTKLTLCCLLIFLLTLPQVFAQKTRPNVVLIITDDQGYGDLGSTGNRHIKTPVLDQLASESVRFTNFYVSPVCAPTRSSLMTGRYSLRTGVHDTFNGGATMAGNEATIAEVLKQADYATGIFGKWHLGDNYPSRPKDQGFDESVIHLSGGMGQVGDFTTYYQGDRSYFDPVLWQNGKQRAFTGYCSDIFTDEAIRFISAERENPFFCYLSFNAPHTPLQVPDSYYDMYKNIDPSSGFDDGRPFPEMSGKDKEDARKVYAMVSNIDDNVGRLFQTLKELKLEENTIVIFMTDNGPQQVRYVGGMRGRKGSVYRGGTRVPFFFKYPERYKKSAEIETMTAHIDVLPTLAELCKVQMPHDRKVDGMSMVPLLDGRQVDWKDRPLFSYWTRKYPERYNNMALQKGNYKLVGHADYNAQITDFELFDLQADPYEQHNIVGEQPETAKSLKLLMDQHYNELVQSENLTSPHRIPIGTTHENPVFLNRNDASGERGIWAQEEIFGKWAVDINEGRYNIKFKFVMPLQEEGQMVLETGTIVNQFKSTGKDQDVLEMKNVYLPNLTGDLIPFYQTKSRRIFPFWVAIEKL